MQCGRCRSRQVGQEIKQNEGVISFKTHCRTCGDRTQGTFEGTLNEYLNGKKLSEREKLKRWRNHR
jgi:hypothetical protein